MSKRTVAWGLAPETIARLLKASNFCAVPACVPVVLALLALGVAAVAIGWWTSLPVVLPGDELYAIERVTALTFQTLLGLTRAPDEPQLAPLGWMGIALVATGLGVLVLGLALQAGRPWIQHKLMRAARNLRLVLAHDETGVIVPETHPPATLVRLVPPMTKLPTGPWLSAQLGTRSLEQTLMHCAPRVLELVALDGAADRNLELARCLIARRRASAATEPLQRLRLRIDSRAQRVAIGRDGFGEFAGAAADLRLVSLPEARCRRLLREQPPNKVRVLELSGRPALVIIGLRETGIELLVRLCSQAQSPALEPLVVAIVDTEAPSIAYDLYNACPALIGIVEIIGISLETTLPHSVETLLTRLGNAGLTPTCIYLALEDIALTNAWERELALATRTFGCPAALVLPVRHPRWLDFGRSVLAEEEALDVLPRRLHADYLHQWHHSGRPASAATVEWALLPFDYQEDSRAVADHLWTKARDLDLRIVPGSQALTRLPANHAIEALAAAEHRRWIATRALAGWRAGAVRSDPQRVHPLMVSWSALAEADREKDRNVLFGMPDTLATAQLGVQPLISFAVPRAVRNPERALEAACRSARDATQPAVAHFIVSVESTASFRLAQAIAARADAALSLVITQPLTSLALAAQQAPDTAAELMAACWTAWLTRPDAIDRVLERWPVLREAD